MSKFRIIPVIDILNSIVVHAIKGERNNYKPLNSELFNNSKPENIISTLYEKYSFNEMYIADLDAILKRKPNIRLFQDCFRTIPIKTLLDPGIIDEKDIMLFSKLKINKLILGLETITSLELIKYAFKKLGSERIIISLDMFKGKILSNNKQILKKTPLDLVQILEKLRIRELILLDLSKVGTKEGNIPPLYEKIKNSFKGKVLVGGGIKNIEHVRKYKSIGFSGVLIATALYDGTISPKALKNV